MRQSARLTMATVFAFAALGAGASAVPAGDACFGDCNGDGQVMVDELITLVNIGLGAASIDECPGGGGADGAVSVDDLVRAVARSLTGCGGTPGGGLRLRPAAGPPGSPLLATGTGLSTATCRVDFHLGTPDGPPLGSGVPDGEGGFSANLFIPTDASSGAVAVFMQAIEGNGDACASLGADRRSAPFTVDPSRYLIRFRTRAFVPPEALQLDEIRALHNPGTDVVHFLLQFRELPSEAEQRALADAGVTLLSYATGNAYVASSTLDGLDALSAASNVRFAGPLAATDKISPDLSDGNIGPWAQNENGVVVTIQFHADVSPERASTIVARFGDEVGAAPSVPTITAILPLNQVEALAANEAVLSIDVVAPPLEGHNDSARVAANVTPLATAPYNLNGAGVTVLVYDVGRLDTHTDFGTRILQNDGSNIADHSTHVGGTVGGSGANSNGMDSAGTANGGTANQWAGMAPSCNLRSFGLTGTTDTLYDSAGDLNGDFMTALNAGTDLATMSLGNNVKSNCFMCAQLGDYTNTAILIDNIVRGTINGQQLIYFQSAGNERGNRPNGCALAACAAAATPFSSIASPATSKNGICVGAVNSNDNSMTNFSSFGPTDDGRLKPDISGPGCQSNGDLGLTSPSFIDQDPDGAGPMRPNGILDAGETQNAYVVKCGTSMSTPAAAGSTALLIQQWRSTRGAASRPLPHTVKAILAHTATDRGNAGPDYQFGFGTFNAQAAVDLVRADDTANIITVDQVSAGQTDFYTFNSAGTTNPRVTLAWDDPAGVRLAAVTLVNDLDLRLIDPDGVVFQPFVLNPAMPAAAATTGNDARNNVEMIVGTAKAGSWSVQVAGTTVPQGPQQYTLIAPDAVMNRKPVCDADGPYAFECTVAGPLDGSGSSDPDGDAITLSWTGPFIPSPASGVHPTVAFGSTGGGAVSLAVSDGKATSTCGSTVVVHDTLPPVLPPDVTAECTSPVGTPVVLGTPTDLCDPSVTFVNDAPALFPLGTTQVSWTAMDDSGNTTTGMQRVDVVDTTPPVITVTATPPELWPPDHRLVNVHVDVQVDDACDAMPAVTLFSITSSDPDSGTGPHDKPNDVQGATFGTDDRFFRLRAEHHPGGLRNYTVTYRAVDASGNASLGSVVVRVPKSIAELVSRGAGAGNGASVAVAVDGDGRFVAFPSDGTNLVAGDDNLVRDVFVRDRVSRTTELITVDHAGGPANGPSHGQGGAPALSEDGRLVAFYSDATDLIATDGNGVADVFLRDRVTGTTDRLSVGLGGEANGGSQFPSISADGRFVAFQSLASNLIASDTNGVADVFVIDRASGVIERPCDSPQGDAASTRPAISPDGRFVAFQSSASNLVAGDTNGRIDIFLCDRDTGAVTRVSVSTAGGEANGDSLLAAVSLDGGVVAFKSVADNLVPDDHNGVVDVFARDIVAGTTERVSVSRTQVDADDAAFPPGISHDGRFVVFGSLATNLVDADANQVPNVFVRDRSVGRTLMADVNDDGETGNGAALDVAPALTGDGIQIGFVSVADNLVALPSETANVFVVCNPFLATAPAVPPSGP